MVVKNSTLCYLRKNGKYLMLLRNKKKNDINGGKWIGVGGHNELGESPEDCIRREIYEETGYVVDMLEFRGILTFVYGGDITEYIYLFTSEKFHGDEIECCEGELHWIDADKIQELNLWEGDRIFHKLLLERDKFFSLKLVYDDNDILLEAVLDGDKDLLSVQEEKR
ncbi:8-oxo-dGTP diphosphatase [Lachnospiraceae bacterium KH1T2]|nr:8-oxo-dGTP diphosphatase [Lachnospiraceae bacterium KH1T2]